MSNQNFADNEKERESTNTVSYLGRIINPPEIPAISNVISAIQSRSIPFPSGNPNSHEGPIVNPPFPPNIEPRVLAMGLVNRQRKSKKMLNEFFIYRGEYVRELKRLNIRPKQTRVSALASTSWHNQPPDVKDEYRRLARETEKLFIAEKQREASEASEPRTVTVSNISLPEDPTPTSTPPANVSTNISLQDKFLKNTKSTSTPVTANFQLPLPTLLEVPMSGLQLNNNYLDNYCGRNLYQMHSNYLFPYLRSTPTTPYIVNPTYYNNNETIVPSQSVQENDFFTNYHQTR